MKKEKEIKGGKRVGEKSQEEYKREFMEFFKKEGKTENFMKLDREEQLRVIKKYRK